MKSLSDVHRSKGNEVHTNSEADTLIIAFQLESRYTEA